MHSSADDILQQGTGYLFDECVRNPPLSLLQTSESSCIPRVNPIYYVGFTSCTIFASFILFQDFYVIDTLNSVSLVAGFLITFFGVHLLNYSLDRSDIPMNGHLPLENGLMNPRISLSGRLSMDGWGNHRRSSSFSGPAPGSARSAAFGGRAHQSGTLFNAYDDEHGGVRLNSLHETEEDDLDLDDSNELTQLRSGKDRRGAVVESSVGVNGVRSSRTR